MHLPLPSTLLIFTLTLLNTTPTVLAQSPSDLPLDTPVSQILTLASNALTAGSSSDALSYYSLAISRDPSNYLTFFKRGATYLSLGRSSQASADFDKCLTLKPGFEGALVQRAKVRARAGDWDGARGDYTQAGGKEGEIGEVGEAEGAAMLAREAQGKKDWEACVSQAGTAIFVAAQNVELRRLRANCRLEKGEVAEAVSDLQQIMKMAPGGSGMEETALSISAATFYGLGEREKGIEAIRGCLHSDPENKKCGRLFKRQKKVDKELKKVEGLIEKRSFSGAVRMLVPTGEEPGLIGMVREDVNEAREQGTLHPKAKEELVTILLEMTCSAYTEVSLHAYPHTAIQLTHHPDEQPQAWRPLLHRTSHPLTNLPPRPPPQSPNPTRRRRLRTLPPNPPHRYRNPRPNAKDPANTTESPNPPQALQIKRLLQSPRHLKGRLRKGDQARLPESKQDQPPGQGPRRERGEAQGR